MASGRPRSRHRRHVHVRWPRGPAAVVSHMHARPAEQHRARTKGMLLRSRTSGRGGLVEPSESACPVDPHGVQRLPAARAGRDADRGHHGGEPAVGDADLVAAAEPRDERAPVDWRWFGHERHRTRPTGGPGGVLRAGGTALRELWHRAPCRLLRFDVPGQVEVGGRPVPGTGAGSRGVVSAAAGVLGGSTQGAGQAGDHLGELAHAGGGGAVGPVGRTRWRPVQPATAADGSD